MSSYCQCGHVWAEHFGTGSDCGPDPLYECSNTGGCIGDSGTCECEGFDELSPVEYAMPDRGFD